ncbi:GntR family transcriptional regulator [Azorhizobium oxalatiphilum]|uniref:GntR family transcriptional regulator n=1 Tax=Azorhizobium oxalatiphilum TaxID=980631 RepID=A0A917FBW8_9HYPH|nr:GntR family transcriptional regulator [Azorhizobium oxalatiphilum]GGF66277.1 GntR family transcriptional regulator [Azorhizobium oxalatiphilum]
MTLERNNGRWGMGTESFGLPQKVRAIPASARIHALLREQIIGMEIAPGTALQEKQIALSCGVSRTPVREAILKLADERLVDIFPQHGTFVSRISVPAMRDAMVIRQALEGAAVRGAAAIADEAGIVRLQRLLAEQKATHDAGHLAAFHATDEAFHQAIAEIAGHPNLWRVVRQEKAQVDRCRILSLPAADRRLLVIADHAAIVEGIAAHDPDAAEAAMRHHLGAVMPVVSLMVERHPGYFEGLEAAPEIKAAPPANGAKSAAKTTTKTKTSRERKR